MAKTGRFPRTWSVWCLGILSPADGSLFHEYLGWWGIWVSVGPSDMGPGVSEGAQGILGYCARVPYAGPTRPVPGSSHVGAHGGSILGHCTRPLTYIQPNKPVASRAEHRSRNT